ncbi:MAG: hypothetical protein DRQ46_07915 [Gammaproteobacteria bacterium]|nr:MAG: hypothetical protein DRQ46_07915 [Gammaproteobacteria bacterium]
MIVVKNNESKVLVLKSVQAQPLRLLPGFNHVDLKNLDIYIKNNPAAMALAKASLSILKPGDLAKEEAKEAAEAKKKNDKLNNSAKLLKAAQDKLVKAEAEAKDSGKESKELKEQLANLQAEMGKLLAVKDASKADEVAK